MLRKMSDAEATQPIHRLDARRGPGKRCSLLCPGPRHSTPAELPTGGWSFRLLSCRSSNGSGGKWSRPWGHGEGADRDHDATICTHNLSHHLRRSCTSAFIIPTIHSFSHIPGSIGRPPRAALSAFLGHLARRLGARVANPVGQPSPHIAPKPMEVRGIIIHYRRKLWRSAQQAQKTTC